jgi:hypothetical protein
MKRFSFAQAKMKLKAFIYLKITFVNIFECMYKDFKDLEISRILH